MADEEVLPVPIPAPVDLKRKHQDLEEEDPEIRESDTVAESISVLETMDNPKEEDGSVMNGGDSVSVEAKRPRLDEKADVNSKAFQDKKPGFQEMEDEKPSANIDEEADKPIEGDDNQPMDSKQIASAISERVEDDIPSLTADDQPEENQSLVHSPQLESVELQPSSLSEVLKEEYISSTDEQSMLSTQTTSRRIEVPNAKVGVLIGKSGDTIRSLQNNSNAKIQITRDIEADPNSSMRPVEIIGTLENIIKAEKLIKDVIAEADAGGSPALVARGFNNAQSNEAGEQIEMKVPNEKVGLIIGKGGETIKNLQMRSGVRIQLTQQHGPDGDRSKERTVRLTGSKRQIETAREMIEEVMSQPGRTSSQSSGYGPNQGNRSRGPSGPPPQWRGMRPPPHQPGGYEYNQRGPYPNPNQNQYPTPQYGGYQQQNQQPNVPSRNKNYGPGWDNRPPHSMAPHSGGYDYYSGGGQADPPPSNHGPSMGPPHSSHPNYNYGQDYGQGHYSHGAPPPAHGYGGQSHGPPPYYGGYGSQQQPPPGNSYPQTGGYSQDQYGKPPPSGYGGQPQGQSYYGQGRGPPPLVGESNTQYNQQAYPYGHAQQGYPPYGPAAPTDGYNQQPPHGGPGSAPNYGQQAVSGGAPYGQMGGYGSYQTSSYPEQQQQPVAQNNSGTYGYQSTGDQAAYSGAYAQQQQPVAVAGQQGGYDQSVQQQAVGNAGGYGNGAPAGAGAGTGTGAAPPVGY